MDTITVKRSLGIIATGIVALAYAVGRNIHRVVTRHPWAVIAVMTLAYSTLSLLLYVNCTSKQRAAEAQRDSIAYEYDRVTNTTAYRILK